MSVFSGKLMFLGWLVLAVIFHASIASAEIRVEPGQLSVDSGLSKTLDGDAKSESIHPSTRLVLNVFSPGKQILRFRGEQSQFQSFQDDQGLNLLASGPNSLALTQAVHDPLVGAAGLLILRATVGAAPGDKAKHVKVAGTISVDVASQYDEQRFDRVELEEGKTLTFRETVYTLVDFKEGESPDPPLRFALQSDSQQEGLVQVELYDPESGQILGKTTGSRTTGSIEQGDFAVKRNATLDTKVKVATVVFVTWKDLKREQVSFDLRVPLE